MQDSVSIIDQDPRFHALQRARSRFAWRLTALIVACYYGFILVVAFRPRVLSQRLHAETVVTVGLFCGAAIILLSVLMTGLYVWRANREFDPLNQSILDEATRAQS